ncbi:O-antigen polymerase [Acinetobacter baylyi]|uniref:O-antigen polymerase n=1 Tax=Acinetobacter baylyi TaxID=202950 RepID=UPI000EA27CE8|nr:O-antigen polymerase [Acinetobacter baylyi]
MIKFGKIDISSLWWIFSLLSIYSAEILDKLNRSAGEGRVGAAIRIFLIMGSCLYIFLSTRKNVQEKSYLLFIMVLISISLGMIFTVIHYDFSLISSIYMLVRYYAGLVFLICSVITINNIKDRNVESSLKVIGLTFIFIFFVNIIFALYGYFFDLDIFKTYGYFLNQSNIDFYYDSRFGFNGFIVEQNISSYFFFIGFVILYFTYIKKRSKLYLPFYTFFVLIISLLTGTKTLFAMSLFFIFFIFVEKSILRFLFLTLISFLSIFYIVIKDKFDILTNFDFWNFVLSNRLGFVWERFFSGGYKIIIPNMLFGTFYDDGSKFLVELEFVDLFNFLGLFGGVIYLFVVYLCVRASLSYLNYKNALSAIFIILIACFFSGHLFYDPTSSFFFSYLILFIGLLGRKNELSKRF